MTSPVSGIDAFLAKVDDLLHGEAARLIAYGSAFVIVGVVVIANALGFTRFGQGIPLQDALVLTTASLATLITVVETIRHYVFSANSVAEIATTPPVAEQVVVAAENAGVPADTIAAADQTPQ